jgi:hypothetical protein
MATKKIIPVNPEAKKDDDAETKDATAERKTLYGKIFRKSARKTANFKF